MQNHVRRIDYQHDYDYAGAQFTVMVERSKELDQDGLEYWRYAVLVKGNVVESNVYSWPKDRRALTNKAACNHIAAFWGPSELVKNSQGLEGSPDYELTQIVERCAAWMHKYFMTDIDEHTDYDIVTKYMDESQWTVVLRPNYIPNRLVEFYSETEKDHIEIHSYIEDNELHAKF